MELASLRFGQIVSPPTRKATEDVPDIHLSAAAAILADTSVRVVGRLLPVANVGLAVDELEITRALRVAVACAVLGTGLVARVLGQTAVLVHGDEVQGAVETAAENCMSGGRSTQGFARFTHPSLDVSTSKVNSLPSRVNIWYLVALAIRYRREPMLVAVHDR
jgi:hypothetical protein